MKSDIVFSCLIYLSLQIYLVKGNCNSPLLENAYLQATSSRTKDHGPKQARLHGDAAWTAKETDFSQYLTVDLRKPHYITAIATQGLPYSMEHVQEYRIEYGNNNMEFTEYKNREGHTRVFEGNVNGNEVKRNDFETPIIAQWIRINPIRWQDRISLRLELYGCTYVAESVHFDGKSYVTKDLSRNPVASRQDTIRFRFRTNHANGVILYSRDTQKDFLAIQLVGNQLLLNIDLGGEGFMSSISIGSLLDDNLWHDVSISRDGKDITLVVDRVVIREKIHGDFSQLDLRREIYLGGLPNFNQDGLVVTSNFTGCIENLYINSTNFIERLKARDRDFAIFGDVIFTCPYEKVIPVTFKTADSYLKLDGYQQKHTNCSFDFRTFNEDGLLLYNKFSHKGFVKLFLEKGKIKIDLQGEDTPRVVTEAFERPLNDGQWHKTVLVLQTNKIELNVDGKPSNTIRKFSMTAGTDYFIGGGVHGSHGFIGCMRYVFIDGRYIPLNTLSTEAYTSGIVFDACQMVDRCNPNPCEHGGTCKQNWEEFTCECSQTGYAGAVCHISRHSLSCEAYKIDNPTALGEVPINIDIDGSGPLNPFPVTCHFPAREAPLTYLHHKNERPTDVKGFSQAGSFIRDIVYNAKMDQITQLVNRSYNCRQNLRYECLNARLFNSPVPKGDPFDPYSWWVSRSNQKMDYWGGSLPGTRKCKCGLYGTCRDPNKWCNCDTEAGEWLVDEGEITQKEYLPVRQLRFGDTGSTMDDKKGRYSLGPLICEGDSLFDNVVTFRYTDATIDLPTFDMGHVGDIYFQFKTTAENGVLVHSKGPKDFIKVTLVEGIQIQFTCHAGNSPVVVHAQTSYKLNDNKWHSVLVERNRKEARVVVDGSTSSESREDGTVRALHLTSKLVIGATVDYSEGFVGCLCALTLNGEIIDIRSMAEQGIYGVSPGCVGKCASNPCLNNGTCIEGYAGYTCDCQWTGFKGPICADEIGVNLKSDNYVRYDFETLLSTLEENIRVGFTTTDKTGMILGVSSKSGEYINLMMTASGHLLLVFDFGFERQEIVIKNENFALGQHHNIRIQRSNQGSKVTIYVDEYEPIIHTFKIDDKADAQFSELKSIYVGRNETMGTGQGFIGCISRVQFDDHFPLRRLFQESRRSNVIAHPEDIREDNCGIEPIIYPTEESETRPPPTYLPGVLIEQQRQVVDESAILGGVLAVIFVALILMAILIGRYMSRHKGEYKTHEDTGAKDAQDPDTAIIQSKTGHGVPRRKEWFI